MTLYEIETEIRNFIDAMMNSVDENGELIDIDPARLDELQAEREKKLESIACYIKNLRAESAALKIEADNLTARKKSADSKIERLEKLLSESMTNAGEKNFKSAKCSVSFKASEAVIVPDIELLDSAFVKAKTTYDPDKTAIKAAIKGGQEVRGAYLEQRDNIQIK